MSDPSSAPVTSSASRGRKKSYLLQPEYQRVNVLEYFSLGEQGALELFASARWGENWADEQVCPQCGLVGRHHRYRSLWTWKCRDKACDAQFTVFSGTRLHGTKMAPPKVLSVLAHFVEAKDSISARELAGLHGLSHQTVHVLLLKVREALCDTMSAEPPLSGKIQADAAYFIKYVRPGNVGTGASFSAKADRKNAGLDERGRAKRTVSPSMHALVVFAQCGVQGERRYKVAKIKTETQVDLQELGAKYCTSTSVLVTDQHGAYTPFSALFDEHHAVNHSTEFMSPEGFHTNLAEGFFSRMRHAQGGAWHRMSVQYLELYGWEFAWRQTMVGRSNAEQMADLLKRLLGSGRPNRFADYWGKRPAPPDGSSGPEDTGVAVEIDKRELRKKMGRPSKKRLVPAAGHSAGAVTTTDAADQSDSAQSDQAA